MGEVVGQQVFNHFIKNVTVGEFLKLVPRTDVGDVSLYVFDQADREYAPAIEVEEGDIDMNEEDRSYVRRIAKLRAKLDCDLIYDALPFLSMTYIFKSSSQEALQQGVVECLTNFGEPTIWTELEGMILVANPEDFMVYFNSKGETYMAPLSPCRGVVYKMLPYTKAEALEKAKGEILT